MTLHLNDLSLALDSPSIDVSNFFVNGFIHGKLDFDAVEMFKEFEFIDCNSDRADNFTLEPDAIVCLDAIHGYFARKLISPMCQVYEFGRNGMWFGVDSGSAEWHNDFMDGDPFTSNILIYLEDGSQYDNSIQFKNKFDEFKVVPKPNEFVWINQNKKFMHKATHNSGPRRLLSFEFYIPALI